MKLKLKKCNRCSQMYYRTCPKCNLKKLIKKHIKTILSKLKNNMTEDLKKENTYVTKLIGDYIILYGEDKINDAIIILKTPHKKWFKLI
jgi:hypothetical protein